MTGITCALIFIGFGLFAISKSIDNLTKKE